MSNHPHLEIYTDPINYDLECPEVNLDNSILLDLVAKNAGSVLELGCGTGRVTIPLAQQGIPVTGLDVVPQMIEHARIKATNLPIQWVCEDVRFFQLDTQYALIFSKGLVFQHLLSRTDQEAMLARVREHLVPTGYFIMDVGFKPPASMLDSIAKQDWYDYVDDEGRTIQVAGTDEYDHLHQTWCQTLYRYWQEEQETRYAPPVQLTLRYVMPQEIETLLFYNGFSVVSRYDDWQGSPATDTSYQHIYVCQKRD